MSLPEGNETFDEDTSLGTFLGLSSEHVVKKWNLTLFTFLTLNDLGLSWYRWDLLH